MALLGFVLFVAGVALLVCGLLRVRTARGEWARHSVSVLANVVGCERLEREDGAYYRLSLEYVDLNGQLWRITLYGPQSKPGDRVMIRYDPDKLLSERLAHDFVGSGQAVFMIAGAGLLIMMGFLFMLGRYGR
jgi:hypothetical protein